MKKYSILFYTSIISFFIGIFCANEVFSLQQEFFIFLNLLSSTIWMFLKFKQKNIFSINLLLLSLIFFNSGFGYFNYYYKDKIPRHKVLYNQKIENTHFIVSDEPENKGYRQKIILKIKGDKYNDQFITRVSLLPKLKYGDELKLNGWIVKINNFKPENSEREFDYVNFLKKNDIFYEIKNTKFKIVDHDQGSFLKNKLFWLKRNIVERINQLMPEPSSSLLSGILIGAKEDLGENLLTEFRRTGIIHIVVLSGFNLTILAQFIMIILSIFGRRISTTIGSLAIILFTIMTGGSSTIVRASIMALLVILAHSLGRNAEALKLLFLAGFIMLIFNPMLLFYDASFQLSFLATLGLLLLSKPIENKIRYGKILFLNFREILAATISTQIFVFPLLLYMMGEISTVAPLVNILVLILIPISMIWGIITISFSYLNFGLAVIMSYFNFLYLSYVLWVVHYFSNLNFATWKYSLSAKEMFLIYFSYFLIWISLKYFSKNEIDTEQKKSTYQSL